jgi:hypothetical protein
MKRLAVILYALLVFAISGIAQEVSFEEKKKIAKEYGYTKDNKDNIEAIYIIHLLKQNPLMSENDSRELKLKLFAWMQDTEDVVVYYDSPEAKEIEISNFPYKKNLLQQYINGCSIFDLLNPDKMKDEKADIPMGMKFVCEAYEKIVTTTNTPSHYYYEAQCEKYLGRKTAKGIAEANSKNAKNNNK